MRGVVISGGGAFGACGAGTLAAFDKTYDLVSGVSTGSLMAPLVALRDWERLRTAYTSVRQSDIFDVNPFNSAGKIKVVNAIWRLLRGKKTLGESNNLRRTIDKFITDEDFLQLIARHIEVFVAVQETSYYPESICYFSSKTSTADDFRDWLWASANAPVVTSILQKAYTVGTTTRMGEWCDGGLTELISLTRMIERGATEIDVVLHRYQRPDEYKGGVKDFFHNVVRLFDITRKEIEQDDLLAGLLHAEINGCVVNVYQLPKRLGENSLLFDPQLMSEWWDLGYATAHDPSRLSRFDFVTFPGTGRPPEIAN